MFPEEEGKHWGASGFGAWAAAIVHTNYSWFIMEIHCGSFKCLDTLIKLNSFCFVTVCFSHFG